MVFEKAIRRKKRCFNRCILCSLISSVLCIMLILAGCSVFDPSAELGEREKKAYDLIVSASGLKNVGSVYVMSGSIYAGDLYCYLYVDSTGSEMYRISSDGTMKTIRITLYTLDESDRCLNDSYFDLDKLNEALEKHYDGNNGVTSKANNTIGGIDSMSSADLGGALFGGVSFVTLIAGIIVLVIHIYLAYLAGQIAEDKGYTGWFGRCFWLGPLAFILVAGLPDKSLYVLIKQLTDSESKNDNGGLSDKDSAMLKNGGWRCPECGSLNAGYVTSCGCGMTKNEAERMRSGN